MVAPHPDAPRDSPPERVELDASERREDTRDHTSSQKSGRASNGDAGALRPNAAEVTEWTEALDDVMRRYGASGVQHVVEAVQSHAMRAGVPARFQRCTPYVNTIPKALEPRYPGDLAIERRIKSLIRWNAMAMVVRANRESDGVGGHISTYASAATLYEVALQHFLRGASEEHPGDLVFIQGHASPGIYARAYLEGRLDEDTLRHFRREVGGGGLSSYPHPHLMPDFWQFPTVSMGLGPLMAIYQARFLHYLRDRGVVDPGDRKVWCFIGDGETDEPETLGSLSLAAREGLDNLIFVVNCNLQRLDGPVRGNGKIIQELEGVFHGAGWNVIKVIWGSDWDPLLAADRSGALIERMNEAVDGEFQAYSVESGSYIREEFFGSEELARLVDHLSDEELRRLKRGGHDPRKVYAAYRAAMEHRGGPTVILAKTIKGYGLGEAGEGRNVTHQQKKLNEEELREFRARFGIPLGDDEVRDVAFYKPAADSPEMRYLRERREALGGHVPTRQVAVEPLEPPAAVVFEEFHRGSGDRPAATTAAFVRLLHRLLSDEAVGERVVPIVPDEARTFGMDGLFRKHGIYAHGGQLYEPVDKKNLLYYREAKDGAILEEGITEAGSMSSFIAAGTAYANLGVEMLPFFTFYSMFGFQRVGDLIWAAGDAQAKGFLLGGTAGRTTLNGEGLQHQDGHSHVLAATVPNVKAFDPAYAYELAVIIEDGIQRMLDGQVWLYYLTLYNEPYAMPAMPDDAREGILRGMYRLRERSAEGPVVTLWASGPLVPEAIVAQDRLAEELGIASELWSVTSYKELRADALEVERYNRLHPDEPQRQSYLETMLDTMNGPIVAVSDWMRLVVEQVARWVAGPMVVLGTDGYGRSDTRAALRRHFEVDAAHIAYAAASALADDGLLDESALRRAREAMAIDPDAIDPLQA